MGEYSRGQYKGEHLVNATTEYDTNTGYLEAGYILTGEKYADSYKGGVFGSFKPKNNFDIDNNQWGLLELAFRVEGYNVEDISLTGTGSRVQGNLTSYTGTKVNEYTTVGGNTGAKSSARTYTAGIRWILNPNVVIKANYAYTKLGSAYNPIDTLASTALSPIDSESIVMTRLQYMF
jgi:phosphate-selective porin OprO/OprP